MPTGDHVIPSSYQCIATQVQGDILDKDWEVYYLLICSSMLMRYLHVYCSAMNYDLGIFFFPMIFYQFTKRDSRSLKDLHAVYNL